MHVRVSPTWHTLCDVHGVKYYVRVVVASEIIITGCGTLIHRAAGAYIMVAP